MKNSFKKALTAILIIACGVWALDNVSYIDENGEQQIVSGVTTINSDGGKRTLSTGWYLMQGTFTNNGTINISGTVHIILANNSNVTVNGSGINNDEVAGINVVRGNSLSIYAQTTSNNMGELTATGVTYGAGIGSNWSGGYVYDAGTITITGGKITATGGNYGAGIGGGRSGDGGTITITGGIVMANGHSNGGAGIGGGGYGSGNCNTVKISGGIVTATGGTNGGGIGGGVGVDGGVITISGGIVTATGSGAGIGIGGKKGTGTLTLNGNAVVFASDVGDTYTGRRTKGILFIGNIGTFYGTSVTLERNVTIPSDHTLTIPANATFTIPTGITLTNNGTITSANGSTVTVAGTVTNNGSITPANGSTVAVAGTVNGSNKIVGANTATPTLASKTATSIIINSNLLAVTGQTIEYAKNTVNEVPASGWQTDANFAGLTEKTTYRIFARSKTDTRFATGAVSGGLQATTKGIPTKANFSIPTGHIYNGSAQGFNISIAGMGIATVYYDGSPNQPTNAGTYSVTVDVADGTDFVAASGIVLGDYKISPKPLSITGISASSKEYDGKVTATVTGTAALSGVIGEDKVTVIPGTALFSNKNVGNNRTVTFSGFSLDGIDASNYTLSAQPSGTANITAKPVTIIGITADSKVYDGNTTAIIAGTATVNGKIDGDAVNVVNGNASFANKDAGTGKIVTFANFRLSGTDVGNYTLSAQPASLVANITAKPIAVTAYAKSKIYGSADPMLTYSVVPSLIASDNFSGTLSRTTGDNVGIYTIDQGTLTAGDNYKITFESANFAISAKPVTIAGITVSNKSYDGNATATVTGAATVSGKVGYDDVTVTLGTASFADKNVGTNKAVTFTNITLDGSDADNYILSTHPSLVANITAKPVTIIGITAGNKVYNGNTAATVTGTVTVSGIVGYDDVTATLGTASFSDKNVGTSKAVTFTSITLDGIDAGNYVLSAQPNLTANITAKPVTITGITASSKVYNGYVTTTVTGTATVSGKVDGDNVSVINGTASFADKNVGIDKIVTFSNFALGGVNAGNYTLTAQPASVTANITAKPITIIGVTADDREYNGTTDVSMSGGMLNGVAGGDDVGFELGTGTVATASIGSNKTVSTNITLTGADAGNYTLTQPANITVRIITGSSSSSSDKVTPSSSSTTPSSSSDYSTPISCPQIAKGNISIHTTPNTILISNLPHNTKVDVYNLQGKLIFTSGKSLNLENRSSDNLQIPVQIGMYVVKIGTKTIRAVVR